MNCTLCSGVQVGAHSSCHDAVFELSGAGLLDPFLDTKKRCAWTSQHTAKRHREVAFAVIIGLPVRQLEAFLADRRLCTNLTD